MVENAQLTVKHSVSNKATETGSRFDDQSMLYVKHFAMEAEASRKAA